MISLEKKLEILHQCSLFNTLKVESLKELLPHFDEIEYPEGAIICNEHESAHTLIVMVDGEAEVLKEVHGSKIQHHIATIHTGGLIGELGLLDHRPRSATVKCTKKTHVLSINYKIFSKIIEENEGTQAKIYYKLAQESNNRLRILNQSTVKHMQLQIETAQFMLKMSFVIYLFIFSLEIVKEIATKVKNTTPLSTAVLISFFVVTIYLTNLSKLPFETYGITLKNAKKCAIDAIYYSIPVLIFFVILKYTAIQFIPIYKDNPIFAYDLIRFDLPYLKQTIIMILVYVIGVPLQEYIVRGALQGTLHAFLTGPNKNVFAIGISTLQFCMIHLAVSSRLAIAVLPLGIFWGWMFYKQRSLVGVTVSHILIGVFAFNMLNFEPLLFPK